MLAVEEGYWMVVTLTVTARGATALIYLMLSLSLFNWIFVKALSCTDFEKMQLTGSESSSIPFPLFFSLFFLLVPKLTIQYIFIWVCAASREQP